MEIDVSPVFYANQKAINEGYRIIANQGSSRSGKTYNILYLLILMGMSSDLQIDTVSQTIPHLKKGANKDFKEIMLNNNWWNDDAYNKTDMFYSFSKKSYMQFFSVDNPGKVRGPGRDILFINEANLIDFETWKQLILRTRKTIIIDYNPADPLHWIYDYVLTRDDCKFIQSTYLDNYDFLPKEQIDEIERLKQYDENAWRVYGLGERGTFTEGQIFKNWQRIDRMPDFTPVYGLDFGFTNDPTALVRIMKHNMNIYVEELIYQKGLTNRNLAILMKEAGVGNDVIYADAAEPKSIEELRQYGLNVRPAIKGPDSVNLGINYLKQHQVHFTKDSTNLQKEISFYQWEQSKDAKYLNKPKDFMNHLMDAIRYGVSTLINQTKEVEIFR